MCRCWHAPNLWRAHSCYLSSGEWSVLPHFSDSIQRQLILSSVSVYDPVHCLHVVFKSLSHHCECDCADKCVSLTFRTTRVETPQKRKKRTRYEVIFVHYKLPYHLVMWCYCRVSKQPGRIFGPTRREQLLRVCRKKRSQYYEACTSGSPPAKFFLDEPGISLIQSLVNWLGPGGIPNELCANVGLEHPDPMSGNIKLILACTYSMGRHYNQVKNRNVITTPLVFDTGASSSLIPYKLHLLVYHPVDILVKAVGSIGQVVGMGTTLHCFRIQCGQTVYLPSIAYHMPPADICLESP